MHCHLYPLYLVVEGFGCIVQILCFTTGVPLWGWGTYAETSLERNRSNA